MTDSHTPENCSIGSRVTRIEDEVSSIRNILREVASTQATLARIEERSCNQQGVLDKVLEQTRALVVRIDSLERISDNIDGGKKVLHTLGATLVGLVAICATVYAVFQGK